MTGPRSSVRVPSGTRSRKQQVAQARPTLTEVVSKGGYELTRGTPSGSITDRLSQFRYPSSHVDFWQRTVARVDDVARIRHAKIEVAVLLSDPALLDEVEELPGKRVDTWPSEHADEIDVRPEKRLVVYADIAGTADKPSETTIRPAKRVASKRPKEASQWDGHMSTTKALSSTSSTSPKPRL